MKRHIQVLLAGALVVVPFAITVYVVWSAAGWLGETGTNLLRNTRALDSLNKIFPEGWIYGPRNEVGVTENLQVDEARFDRGRPDEEANGGNDESALQRRAPGVGRRLGHVDDSPLYRRATTDFGGGGVDVTRSITVASSAAGATIPSRLVASRSMRAGDRSVSISRRRCRLTSSSAARSFCISSIR